MNGLGIMISIGKWGGVYFVRGWWCRLAMGWIAITVFPCDGDHIIDLALLASDKIKQAQEAHSEGKSNAEIHSAEPDLDSLQC